MTFLYFAYGSNMLSKRMLINCPSARYKCNAELKKHGFSFSGYADAWKGATAIITEEETDSVWGVVWEISKDHEEALHKQEKEYQPKLVSVCCGNKLIECKTFKPLFQKTNDLPSTIYKNVIIQGAKEHDLPSFYVSRLESFQDNGYKGKVDIPVNIEL